MHEARHSATDHQYSLATLYPGKALSPNGTGERFDERALLVRDSFREQVRPFFHEYGRNEDIPGESPGKALLYFGALRIVSVTAITAFTARDLRRDEYPVTRPVFPDTFSDRLNLSTDLMTLYQGGPRQPVPLDYIASTYAAGMHPDQDLARTGNRCRDLLYADVPVVIPV